MLTSDNQRPGVYSRYDISSAYTSPRSAAHGAVVARASGGEAGVLHTITSLTGLADLFPADTGGSAMRGCVQILLQSGVGKVYAVVVADGDYEQALSLIESVDNIGAVVCDAAGGDLDAVKQSVLASAESLRERVAFCGCADSGDAVDAAGALNCERVVLCCPAVRPSGGGERHAAYGAAALAGKVLAENDPMYNFSGEMFATIQSPDALEESRVQALLKGGVTVFEQNDGAVECVRALTTRTRTGGETDYALRGLNAILCVDNVIQEMRARLKATLRGARLRGQSLQAIRSQVVVVLSDRQDSGVIESYETPTVYTDDSDPTVCVVELSFGIAHVVSQIHVTAHIQV